MSRCLLITSLILGMMLLGACSDTENYAPVVNAWQQSHESAGHRVQPGETLYSIAFRYNYDYRDLARYNHISAPYTLKIGQLIYFPSEKTLETSQKLNANSKIVKQWHSKIKQWQMPAKGNIVKRYNPRDISAKGIDIANRRGTPIKATASGEVVYSGHGIQGYGNLIIIKHNEEFLSAYAHNDKNLVREGQHVQAGQKIATMGKTGTSTTMLHFEIRKDGKPVNPMRYLG